MAVSVGSIWQDNDPRTKRFVKVVEVSQFESVKIRSCQKDGGQVYAASARWTKADRFGKTTTDGFTLIKDAS